MKTLVLKDRTQIEITDDQAESLEATLIDGKADFLKINGELYSPRSIDRIVKSKATQADIFEDPWADEEHQIEAGRTCRGDRSIQREINDIAKSLDRKQDADNPDTLGWAKLITSTKWREGIRQKLLKADPDNWCDNKTGKCVCYD